MGDAHNKIIDRILLAGATILFLVGGYVLLLTFAPALPNIPLLGTQQINVDTVLAGTRPGERGNRLFIPKINVDVAIAEGNDVSALDIGAWHRQPQNGNPLAGGNFVLSAHRFAMGLTPAHTLAKSPFYNIDKLEPDDELFVDYQSVRYAYKITKRFEVQRTAVEIEAQSNDPKLTLYSCDLRGEKAGRIVIEARPLGPIPG